MTVPVASTRCGPYEVVAQDPETLFELADGSVELYAERSYLVKLGPGSAPDALRGALKVPNRGTEGMLRFENFVGASTLGGRRLAVRSSRLSARAVERMFDQVSQWLASLPFAIDTPSGAEYERVRELGPDALYHAFAFLRDSMRGLGRDDLRAAVNRVLVHPHESLRIDDPRLVPVGAANRFDAETLQAIQSEPELLSPLPDRSPLASHPLARALNGAMPELVRTRPTSHSSDNPENRFVAGALETMIDLLARFERLVREEARVSGTINAAEAREMADTLRRWRNHQVFEGLRPFRGVPLRSTVLRARPGYRELLRIHGDLLGRIRLAEPHDAKALLELRDAATIYEYWCYFQVVAAVGTILGKPLEAGRFAAGTTGTRVPYRFSVRWPEASVVYNETFPRSKSPVDWPGTTSYSLSLRPDITLRTAAHGLHLFDAKLKLEFGRDFAGEDPEAPPRPDAFRNEDLHKMHAYRDALGADSVWVLYPGTMPDPTLYRAPSGGEQGLRGVGAVALRPGVDHDGGLLGLVADLLSGADSIR